MGKRLVAQALARAPARSAGASPRPPSAYCTVSHVTRQGRLPHCTPPPSQQQPRGFPVWPRPTVFRAVAPGSGARPSIAGPIGPGSANRPSCPFARVSSRCSYNTTSLHILTQSQLALARRGGDGPRDERTVHDGRLGYWGEPPRAVGTAPDRPHALWCLRPPPHEPHLGGRRVVDGVGRWGPARAVPDRAGRS